MDGAGETGRAGATGRDYGGRVTAPLLTAAAVDAAAALLADVLPPTPLQRLRARLGRRPVTAGATA